MTFLTPSYLWALLGLAVPIAIHFWSRKKVKVIKVGSTRFFETLDPKQTNSIHLNELWLLVLRMLVIGLIALLLAQPRLKKNIQDSPITYLVEPSLLGDSQMLAMLDTRPDNSIRLLQPQFPKWDGDALDTNDFEVPKYWQLAQEAADMNTDSIVVFTSAFQRGLKGMRPETKANLQWVVFDGGKTKEGSIEAILNADEIELLKVTGSAAAITFEKQVLPVSSNGIQISQAQDSIIIPDENGETKVVLSKNEPIPIQIVYEDSLLDQMKYLASAYRAMGAYLKRKVDVNTTLISDTLYLEKKGQLVWLSHDSVPDYPGNVLVYRPDQLAAQLVMAGPLKNTYHLTQVLNTENIVSENLVEQLMPLLALHPDLDEKVKPYDQRIVALNELRSNQESISKLRKTAQLLDLSPWLWVFLALLIIAERFIAKYRKQ